MQTQGNAHGEFFTAVERQLGAAATNRSSETLTRYGENTMPDGDRRPAGVVYPASTADVQTIVRLANQYSVPMHPVSTGNNIGLGSWSAVFAGQVVMDLGHRMNRILEVDERLAFAVVEPGVSYQAMTLSGANRWGQRSRMAATLPSVRRNNAIGSSMIVRATILPASIS